MAHLNPSWAGILADLGNQPGLHSGDVVIELQGSEPVVCDSDDITVAAEGGTIHGLLLARDGRRVFLPWHVVTSLYDAPEGS